MLIPGTWEAYLIGGGAQSFGNAFGGYHAGAGGGSGGFVHCRFSISSATTAIVSVGQGYFYQQGSSGTNGGSTSLNIGGNVVTAGGGLIGSAIGAGAEGGVGGTNNISSFYTALANTSGNKGNSKYTASTGYNFAATQPANTSYGYGWADSNPTSGNNIRPNGYCRIVKIS